LTADITDIDPNSVLSAIQKTLYCYETLKCYLLTPVITAGSTAVSATAKIPISGTYDEIQAQTQLATQVEQNARAVKAGDSLGGTVQGTPVVRVSKAVPLPYQVAPPPPSPPLLCALACNVLKDGASLDSTSYGTLCLKHEGYGTACRPDYGRLCDGQTCLLYGAVGSSGGPCADSTDGKWATKKCAKKARKGKCHKKKITNKCPKTCNKCA